MKPDRQTGEKFGPASQGNAVNHRTFYVIVVASAIVLTALWFIFFDTNPPFDTLDIVFEGAYLFAAIVSFSLIYKFGLVLNVGWVVLTFGLLIDFLDEMTSDPDFLSVHLEGVVTSVGLLTIAAGFYEILSRRRRQEEELRRSTDRLRKLHDGVDQLQRQNREEDVLRTAINVAESILDFSLCSISIREDDRLIPRATSSGIEPDFTREFKLGEGITGKTAREGNTIWGDDVREYADAEPASNRFKAFISVPIGKLGTFQVVSEEVGSFDKLDVEFVEILMGHLREELKRVRLEEELHEQAIRDPLTGLYNRRYFNETLKKEVQRAERYDKPLAFLMLDINSFKQINDRYSHQTGDEVLEKVADLLRENFRDADTVVRYGGDEFLVMMPETDGGATEVLNRLDEELDKWNEESDLLDNPLVLATGLSHWDPDQERDVEEALNEADKKMYEDKRS